MGERLGALVADLDIAEAEQRARVHQEPSLLADRLDAGEGRVRHSDSQGEPRKSRATPNVNDPLPSGPNAHRARGEGIEEVLHRHRFELGDRGEVHGRITFDELARVPLAHRDLRGRELEADRGRAHRELEELAMSDRGHAGYRMALRSAASLVVLVFALGVTPATVADGASRTVTIQSFAFTPLTITVGDTVTWQNRDDTTHTATSDANAFDTGQLPPGASSRAIP